jgi:hypothetical protein
MRVSMDLWRREGRRRLADIVSEVFDLYAAGLASAPAPTESRSRHRVRTAAKA